MEYTLLTEHFILLGLVAMLGGFISAIAGSSGMLVLPSLLLAGLPAATAIGTTKLYTTASLFSSNLAFLKKKIFNYRYWIAASIATLVGGTIGVGLLQLFNPSTLNKIIPFLLIFAAIFALFSKNILKKNSKNYITVSAENNSFSSEENYEESSKPLLKKVFSVILGIYSGFIGAGTNLLWIALLRHFCNCNLFKANVIANFMSFFSNISALITFLFFGQVDIYLGVFLAIAGVIGSYFGAKFAITWGTKFVKPMIVFTTCAISLKFMVSA